MSAVFAWLNIFRMGLVQASMGAMTVIPLTTLPRVMQNELGLLALSAGILVGWYYAFQVSRVAVGYASDTVGQRAPFVIFGLAILAVSSVAATWSITVMEGDTAMGFALALLGYAGVGIGVGTSGTAILTIVALNVTAERRAPAATIVWLVMIFGIGLTATLAGQAMTPFTFERMVEVSIVVAIAALAVGYVMLYGLDRHAAGDTARTRERFSLGGTLSAVRAVWAEPATRTFTIFVFVAMVAYNMQELVLETYLGTIFGLDAGESTRVSGYHRMAIAPGLIAAAVVGRLLKGSPRALVGLSVGGCAGSGIALGGLALAALMPEGWPVVTNVALFGFMNGVFAGGAVASMYGLATLGSAQREGTRLGAWGLAQAVGFGTGLFVGAGLLDAVRGTLGASPAFASVFGTEGLLFLIAAALALRISRASTLVGAPHPGPAARTA